MSGLVVLTVLAWLCGCETLFRLVMIVWALVVVGGVIALAAEFFDGAGGSPPTEDDLERRDQAGQDAFLLSLLRRSGWTPDMEPIHSIPEYVEWCATSPHYVADLPPVPAEVDWYFEMQLDAARMHGEDED